MSDIVSFEDAKRLADRGFNYKTDYCYVTDGKKVAVSGYYGLPLGTFDKDAILTVYPAPTNEELETSMKMNYLVERFLQDNTVVSRKNPGGWV